MSQNQELLPELNTSAWRRNLPKRNEALLLTYQRLLLLHQKEIITADELEQQRFDIAQKIGTDPASLINTDTGNSQTEELKPLE